jgi:hypothetical protein
MRGEGGRTCWYWGIQYISSSSKSGEEASGHSMSCQPSRARNASHSSSWVGFRAAGTSCLERLASGTSEGEDEMGTVVGEGMLLGVLSAGLTSRLELRRRLKEGVQYPR